MSEEINEVHIKTYNEWLKYYKNATKEQVIEDLTRDVQYFADAVKDIKDLQQKVEQLEKELNQEKEEFAGLHKVLNNKEEEFEKENYNNVVEISRLKRKVEQLENIRKEAIEYVLKNKLYRFKYDDEELFEITTDKKAKDDLLNILNKGSDKE